MAKTYKLEESALTGWWVWSCGLKGGSASSKADAEKAAKKACGDSFALSPPTFDAEFRRGYLTSFTVANLAGERKTFIEGEISGDLFQYLFGMQSSAVSKPQPAAVVVALLKMMGVYRGGASEEAVKKQHALSAEMFGCLANRKFEGVTLTVADDGRLAWSR